MNNFMFQKLMTTKKQEENKKEENQEAKKASVLANFGVEILENESESTSIQTLNTVHNSDNDDDEEGYAARKTN